MPHTDRYGLSNVYAATPRAGRDARVARDARDGRCGPRAPRPIGTGSGREGRRDSDRGTDRESALYRLQPYPLLLTPETGRVTGGCELTRNVVPQVERVTLTLPSPPRSPLPSHPPPSSWPPSPPALALTVPSRGRLIVESAAAVIPAADPTVEGAHRRRCVCVLSARGRPSRGAGETGSHK